MTAIKVPRNPKKNDLFNPYSYFKSFLLKIFKNTDIYINALRTKAEKKVNSQSS